MIESSTRFSSCSSLASAYSGASLALVDSESNILQEHWSGCEGRGTASKIASIETKKVAAAELEPRSESIIGSAEGPGRLRAAGGRARTGGGQPDVPGRQALMTRAPGAEEEECRRLVKGELGEAQQAGGARHGEPGRTARRVGQDRAVQRAGDAGAGLCRAGGMQGRRGARGEAGGRAGRWGLGRLGGQGSRTQLEIPS